MTPLRWALLATSAAAAGLAAFTAAYSGVPRQALDLGAVSLSGLVRSVRALPPL